MCRQNSAYEKEKGRRKGETSQSDKPKDLPAENKLKMRGVQPHMKQEKKKPSMIAIICHVLTVVPVTLLVQPRGIFLSTIR